MEMYVDLRRRLRDDVPLPVHGNRAGAARPYIEADEHAHVYASLLAAFASLWRRTISAS